MKSFFIVFFSFLFLNVCFSQQASNKYLPLEIGNRWDYHIDYYWQGGSHTEDTLSIEIIDTIDLRGSKYIAFSSNVPWYPLSKYFREENGNIYFYNEEDSSDCLAYQFNIPADSSYLSCWGNLIYVFAIDTTFLWGFNDIQQFQDHMNFSEHFGVYTYSGGFFPEFYYNLYGCIISGTTYGNLLVSVDKENKFLYHFKLDQNYPNPFNPVTNISFSIPVGSAVSLKIFDVLGREISTLVNEELFQGEYKYSFDASNCVSGVYFYTLKANNYVSTKKLLLIK